jgi:hypothetical protein
VFHIDIQAIKTGSANEGTDINGTRLAQAHAQRHFASGESLFEFVFHFDQSFALRCIHCVVFIPL